MADAIRLITERKYRDALRAFKPIGPPTHYEDELSNQAAIIIVEALSASAAKLAEYGVPEEQAYAIVFNSVTDQTLFQMMRALWRALVAPTPHQQHLTS